MDETPERPTTQSTGNGELCLDNLEDGETIEVEGHPGSDRDAQSQCELFLNNGMDAKIDTGHADACAEVWSIRIPRCSITNLSR